MDFFSSPDLWIAFVTLLLLEIVLGIDNVVFISILADKLPTEERRKARILGLSLAMVFRIALLVVASWVVGLTAPLFSIGSWDALEISGRDLILILGGAFLVYKAVTEIHEKLEGHEAERSTGRAATFTGLIIQILLLDMVFSLDSVITAVGMVNNIPVMLAAVVIAVGFMLLFSGHISSFINRHPTLKMLALSFLILIGVMLVAESFHREIPKCYIYFAMAFSVGVEILNMSLRKKAPPVQLHEAYVKEKPAK